MRARRALCVCVCVCVSARALAPQEGGKRIQHPPLSKCAQGARCQQQQPKSQTWSLPSNSRSKTRSSAAANSHETPSQCRRRPAAPTRWQRTGSAALGPGQTPRRAPAQRWARCSQGWSTGRRRARLEIDFFVVVVWIYGERFKGFVVVRVQQA